MKRILCILFFYILLAVVLLPAAVTFLLGGFGRGASYMGIGVMF